MALTVSEQMQRRKQQKFRRDFGRVLSSKPAATLDKFIDRVFDLHSNRPTADAFMDMVMASKFGTGNSLSEGGVGFLLETCLKVFNEVQRTKSFSEADLQPWGSYYAGKYDSNDVWISSFLFEFDAKLWPHVTELGVEELVWAQDISPYLFLDKATQAFGFVIVPQPPMTVEEYTNYGSPQITDWAVMVEKQLQKSSTPGFTIFDFNTGPMEYISAVQVVFGTVDKLIKSLPDRVRHNVSPHDRKLSSGKVTKVRAHKRNTPLRLVVNNQVLTDHIVYSVKDHHGQIRYFGEGKRDRWQHVNSGASHNRKINEHYFTKGQMEIEILRTGLTKSEALSIEKFLIRQNSNAKLWNIKDYEPFNKDFDQAMSGQEIQGFFDL